MEKDLMAVKKYTVQSVKKIKKSRVVRFFPELYLWTHKNLGEKVGDSIWDASLICTLNRPNDKKTEFSACHGQASFIFFGKSFFIT